MAASYTAKDILVLEGLEPVRRRPGMYIGGVDATGLHHLLWEIVDNSVDEAMNGHADRIAVTLHKDGASITVTDNGRGIPVDRHTQYKKPALELILTTLHAGGKFEAKNYYHSGGLHGVGASVVTALSEKLDRARQARRRRVGADVRARQVATGPLKKLGAARGSGTTIFFRPDAQDLPDVQLRREAHRRARSRPRPICTAASPSSSHDEAAGTKAELPLRGRPHGLPRQDRRRRRQGAARRRGLHDPEAAGRPPPRLRARLDRGDQRARALLREQHPDHRRRRARERPQERRRQGRAQLPHRPQPRCRAA